MTRAMRQRKGVAPIIATLLLVAIAVVGGILIFVFAQGFFTKADVRAPKSDSLLIMGYDISDEDTLINHHGNPLPLNPAENPDSKLDGGDAFTLWVRNTGPSPLTIEEIIIGGISYTWDADSGTSALSDTIPGTGEFALTRTTTGTGKQLIEAGQEMTLAVRYSDTENGDVKIGRGIKVTVETSNNGVFTAELTNGYVT